MDRIFSEDELGLYKRLVELGQNHLFDDWDPPGQNDDKKHDMMKQLSVLDREYPVEGGLTSYISRSRQLLADAESGVNPLADWVPVMNTDSDRGLLDPMESDFMSLEQVGLGEIGKCAFILVAGGLGKQMVLLWFLYINVVFYKIWQLCFF